jgi:cell division protein FtsW
MDKAPDKQLIPDHHRPLGHTDRTLALSVLVLTAIGAVVMLSASAGISLERTGSPSSLWLSHVARVVAGTLVMIILWRLDYHYLRWLSRPLLLLVIALLAVVLLLHWGKSVGRWINILGVSFQPSEIAKAVLVLFLADALIRKREQLAELSGTVPFVIIIAVIAALVALEPNFSMAAMIVLLGGTMLFLGGMRLRYLIATAALMLPALLIYMYSASYRRARLMTYLNPLSDTKGDGYQVSQSLIGLGRGGLFGVGPGNGMQKFHFLPEPYKDFIFSILGEEWGLIGTMLVLTLFVVVFWRGMRIAKLAPDDFGRLLAAGIVFSITYNALINVGVATAMVPTTGLPLPYLSYGGTSLLMFLASVGVLLNISRHGLSPEERGG